MANDNVSELADLQIMTTVAMKGVLGELEPEFRRATGRGFAMTFGPSGVTLERLKSGLACDVVISSPATFAAVADTGAILAGSLRNVARSVVGLAVRAGAPRPKIGTVEEFKRALLDAKSIAHSNPATGAASGVHFVMIIDRLGITDAVRPKAKLGGGGPVAEFVARGEAELAIQQVCELMLVDGVDVVGPLPAELQSVTTLAVALHSRAPAPAAAQALIDLLVSPRVQSGLHKHGLEPAA